MDGSASMDSGLLSPLSAVSPLSVFADYKGDQPMPQLTPVEGAHIRSQPAATDKHSSSDSGRAREKAARRSDEKSGGEAQEKSNNVKADKGGHSKNNMAVNKASTPMATNNMQSGKTDKTNQTAKKSSADKPKSEKPKSEKRKRGRPPGKRSSETTVAPADSADTKPQSSEQSEEKPPVSPVVSSISDLSTVSPITTSVLSPLISPVKSPAKDWISMLRDLQQKLMSLTDDGIQQRIIGIIADTGCYCVGSATFDFDLYRLDRDTVHQLQQMIGNSTMECG